MLHRFFFLLVLWFSCCAIYASDYINLDTAMLNNHTFSCGKIVRGTYEWRCTYRSTTRRGDTLTLSGKLFVPVEEPKGIILLPHFTITGSDEVPSECTPIEARHLKRHYIVIMPDYIGYGTSAYQPDGSRRWHPYLDAEVAARNTVDMFFAARGFVERIGKMPQNDSLIIVGFSQGAQTAIAALRLFEQNYPEVPLRVCYAGSGPYDVAATFNRSVAENRIGLAFTVPMLILGTSEAYNLNLQPSYFFTSECMKRYPEVMSQQYGLIAMGLRMRSHTLSDYLTSAGADKSLPQTARFYEGLKRSSIVYICDADTIFPDWSPRTNIILFHSTNDNAVTFYCALHLQAFLQARHANVEYDFGRYGDHLMSGMRFLRKVVADLQ